MLKGLREQEQTNEIGKLRVRIGQLTYAAQAGIRGERNVLENIFPSSKTNFSSSKQWEKLKIKGL